MLDCSPCQILRRTDQSVYDHWFTFLFWFFSSSSFEIFIHNKKQFLDFDLLSKETIIVLFIQSSLQDYQQS